MAEHEARATGEIEPHSALLDAVDIAFNFRNIEFYNLEPDDDQEEPILVSGSARLIVGYDPAKKSHVEITEKISILILNGTETEDRRLIIEWEDLEETIEFDLDLAHATVEGGIVTDSKSQKYRIAARQAINALMHCMDF
jgi:hypothetical protein